MTKTTYLILPLRDIVIFPHMIAPLFVGRIKSINAIEAVMEENQEIILLTQKKPSTEDPKEKDLYKVGTLGNILQMLKLPDGTVKVLVEGKSRCVVKNIKISSSYLSTDSILSKKEEASLVKSNEIITSLLDLFERYAKLNGKISPEILSTISDIKDANTLSDTIINHLVFNIEEKQSFLEMINPIERIESLILKIKNEIEILSSEKKIRSRVKTQMEKTQREYYLNEQLKAIQKELGEIDEGKDELTNLSKAITEAKMPKLAKEKI